MILGSKLRRIFNFDNDFDLDKATYIWPSENFLCLINYKQTAAGLSITSSNLCTVHAHARVSGN